MVAFLLDVIPGSVIGGVCQRESILQVLLFAVMFGLPCIVWAAKAS